MIEDRQGVVWVAAPSRALPLRRQPWTLLSGAEGYPVAEAFSIFEDRAGALWVGTAAGVYRRTSNTFELVDRDKNVQSLAEDSSGAIWVTDSNEVDPPARRRKRAARRRDRCACRRAAGACSAIAAARCGWRRSAAA